MGKVPETHQKTGWTQGWTEMDRYDRANTTENLGGGQRDVHCTIFSVFLYV